MVYKSGQIFLPFCHNACTRVTDRQTDGRTDRQKEFSSLDRVCIACSAVKMELKNRSFQYGKVALAVRTQNISYSLCSKWPPFARTHAPAYSNTPLSNCSVNDVLVEETTLLDETLFQVVDVANPAMVDALLEHAPRLIVHAI